MENEIKNDRWEWDHKRKEKWYFYQWDRDEKRKSIEDYIHYWIANCVWVYTPAFQYPSNWVLNIRDIKTRKIIYKHLGSHRFFKTKEECIECYKVGRQERYNKHIIEKAERRIIQRKETIKQAKKSIKYWEEIKKQTNLSNPNETLGF